MKNKIIVVIVVILAVFLTNAVSAADVNSPVVDETVYVLFSANGSIIREEVVVKVAKGTDKFEIFGEFSNIKKMTDLSEYQYDGNKLIWNLSKIAGDLYFQTDTDNEIPITIKAIHMLNGTIINPEISGGLSGRYSLKINIDENLSAAPEQLGKCLVQIQLQVDSEKARNIMSKDAVKITSGKFIQFIWTVFPGEAGVLLIEYDTESLETEDISITLTEYKVSLPAGFGEMEAGLSMMSRSSYDMADGTEQIIDGLDEQSDGLATFGHGINDMAEGGRIMSTEMNNYGTGLEMYMDGIDKTADGLSRTTDAVLSLNEGVIQNSAAYSKISGRYMESASGFEALADIAAELAKGNNPAAVQLSEGLTAAIAGLNELNTSLNFVNEGLQTVEKGMAEAVIGLNTISDGLTEATGENEKLTTGYKGIATGCSDIFSGIEETGKAVSKFESGIGGIKEPLALMAMGNREIAVGLEKMEKGIGDFSAGTDLKSVSFLNNKSRIASTQFIMKMEGIQKPDMDKYYKQEIKTTWLNRLWDRVADLFTFNK